jgi:RsiW-degrading membrane proteinase PrsW (M82 family)
VSTRPGDLRAAQLVAIEQSGWGRRFRAWQPHNLAMWVGVFLVVTGALTFSQEWSAQPHVYAPAMLLGVAVWALYCVPWLLFLHHKERYEREPARLALWGFLYGGLGATFGIAIHGNGAILSLWGKFVSPQFARTWGPSLTAPLVEESAKAAGFVLLLAMAPRLIRTAYDGLIVGAFIGLGFQVFENWLYTVQGAADDLGSNQVATVAKTFLVRGIATGWYSHALYSALCCAGLVWLIGRPQEPRRVVRGTVLVLLAVAGHASLDAVGAIGLRWAVPTAITVVLGVFAAERWAARQERAWMRDLMAPEVGRGTITAVELHALAGSHRDRRRFVRAAEHHHDHRHARHVIHAGTDLAEQIASAGGADTPGVEFARAEVLRLRSGYGRAGRRRRGH